MRTRLPCFSQPYSNDTLLTPDPPESWGLDMMNAFPSTTEKLIERNSTKPVTGEKKRRKNILNTLILTVTVNKENKN